MKLIRILTKLFVLGLVSLTVSWNLPAPYSLLKKPKDTSEELDYVVVKQNGHMKKINRNEELSFVRGDVLKITQAFLKDSQKTIQRVYLTGHQDASDVREKILDTSTELTQAEGSLDAESSIYPLIVQSEKTLHGVIYFHRIEPTLSYVDILVNGKNRVMREGEKLQVKNSDHFRVTNVVTNIEENKNISFTVVSKSKKNTNPRTKEYEILFRHKAYVFAKIPMTVESL